VVHRCQSAAAYSPGGHNLRKRSDNELLTKAIKHAVAGQVELAQILREHSPQGCLSSRNLTGSGARAHLVAIMRTEHAPPVDRRHRTRLPPRSCDQWAATSSEYPAGSWPMMWR
jgi:hypothetical protein